VTFWLDKVPPTASTIFGDRWNLTVRVTKPDGTTQNFGPFKTDDVGGTYMIYTPQTVGTYYFQMSFAGQKIVGANPPPTGTTTGAASINDTYLPSTSQNVALTVQQEPTKPWPATPLPTGYWARPLNQLNPEWRTIAGDWLMSGYDVLGNRYNPFTTAPESGHVVWTYPVAFGGVVGGNYTDVNYYTGLTYESKFNSPLIMYGRLFFNLPMSTSAGAGGAVCIDLRTGKQLWWQNNTRISMGQEFNYMSPNQFGIIPYLWQTGSTYNVFDPYTGQWIFCIENASTGTTTFGPDGELLVYILNGARSWLALWNSTKAIMYYQEPGVLPGGNVWQWRPFMQTRMDFKRGIMWNVTTPDYRDPAAQSISKVTSDVILAVASAGISGSQNWQMEIGYSAKDGHQLWSVNRTTPMGATTWGLMGPAAGDVYTEFLQSTTQWYGYSMSTGQKLWGPTEAYPRAFGMYSWQASIAYNMLLAIDFGGYLHAFDLQTGKKVWSWFAGTSDLETAYGAWPLNNPPPVSADGKIYVTAGHGYNPPLFKGARMYCINATDGTLIWSLLGFHTYNSVLIADGYMVAYNSYDGQIYCYGKGKTETTIQVAPEVSGRGSSVLIKGTITDQSPGATDTPAIADASMTPWMEYLYEQQPKPNNATGVKVHLTAIDPNGNFQDIGTPVSDEMGLYSIMWTPPVPGKYVVTATFDGSKSYYPSSARTAFGVLETAAAPAVIPTPTQAPPTATPVVPPTSTPVQSVSPSPTQAVTPPTSAEPTTTYIAIGISVVIIVVVAAALLLRRRK
jgi:outer membrane protein assembly factor BamB